MRRLATLLLGLGLGLGAAACFDEPTGPEPIPLEETEFAPELGVDLDQMTRTPSGVYFTDLVVGEGETAQGGTVITVHYTGWLSDGQKFDTSVGQEPLSVELGKGHLIEGFEIGVEGMKEGGKRRIVIPYNLAYGATGTGNGVIPPYAHLVFEIELIDVTAAAGP